MRSQILSVGSDLCERVFRKWRQASIPTFGGMFVYKEETSSVTRIALLGKVPSSWSLRRKWVVSLRNQENSQKIKSEQEVLNGESSLVLSVKLYISFVDDI